MENGYWNRMDEDAIHEPIDLLHSLVPLVHRPSASGIIDRFPRCSNFYSFIRRYHGVIGKELRNQRGIEGSSVEARTTMMHQVML